MLLDGQQDNRRHLLATAYIQWAVFDFCVTRSRVSWVAVRFTVTTSNTNIGSTVCKCLVPSSNRRGCYLSNNSQSGPRPQNPNLLQHVPAEEPEHGFDASQPSLKSQVERQPAPQWSLSVPQYPYLEQQPLAQSFVALQSCASTV